MSLNGALRALKTANKSEINGTGDMRKLPANILETFIPGFSMIAQFMYEAIGFDITLLVSISLLLFGLMTALRYIGRHAYDWFEEYCMSYIRIDCNDDIYEHLMDWISKHKVSATSRKLSVMTDHEEESWDFLDKASQNIDATGFINFSTLEATNPPKFQPALGTHYFFHHGNLFAFTRGQKQIMSSGWGGSLVRDEEDITLSCIGRSTGPIKRLIAEARQHFLKKEVACTSVRRPAPKELRDRARFWNKVATRPSRPMHTVVLEHDQKNKVLDDINEYLHPSTKFWYAHRGIPYRRGYLFHGPPGTGKSSLAWAIAGVFGLDIYCISLVDPTLTEENLSGMFTSLPRRCVVLLEDIDSAGLSNRQEEAKVAQAATADTSTNEAAKIGAEITKALDTVKKNSEKSGEKKGITLSGLLNAIDGVASHEGRVLVMTTNFPDNLDDALIRPGRIDMKVEFTLATKSQIFELFTKMYSPEITISDEAAAAGPANPFKLEPAPKKVTPVNGTTTNPLNGSMGHANPLKPINLTPPETPKRPGSPFTSMSPDNTTTTNGTNHKSKLSTDLSDALSGAAVPDSSDIESIASLFADRLPENTFTPAEIQGFLLTRKKEPLRALEEVVAWKDATIAAKEKKASIMAISAGTATAPAAATTATTTTTSSEGTSETTSES